MTAAARMRRSRARRREGRRVLRVEVDETLLEFALVKLEYMTPTRADDPKEIEAALSVMLDRLLVNVTRNAVE